MATITGKPRGYFQYLLAIDCETTGLCFDAPTPVYDPETGERHQAVSWGIVVADAETLKPVDELYVEIKWNDESKKQQEKNPEFGKRAQQVHGLSRGYLEEHGFTEEQAVIAMATLILKYWGPEVSVRTLGHNVHMFDLPFFMDLFKRYGVDLTFGNRHYDTNSVGFVNYKTFNSDDLFECVGFDQRNAHNALDDAKMALEAARMTRVVFQQMIS